MRFSSEFIDKVRDANNIVDVISQYSQLKRSGGRLMGLCPFPDHNEKTPSFSVSETKQVYYCFGCKKAGNIFSFLQEMQGLNFPEAIEYLANKAGIALPEREDKKDLVKNEGHRDYKKLLWRVNAFASHYFQQKLKSFASDHPFIEYCKSRGIYNEEIIQIFHLGASTADWEGLVEAMKRQNVPLDTAETLGLIRARKKGQTGHYDLFRHRLMFPIISHTGHVVGFGGRIVGEGEPKYLNSPDSPVFHKGRTLYGLFESAKYIRLQDQVLVVEGYMDLISLFAAGIRNVVAPLGTALTRDHAALLKRHTKNVVLLFDGDEAGQTAAERSLPILTAEGLFAKSCVLPEGLDPDDFVRTQGAPALKQKIEESPDLFYVIFNRIFESYHGSSSEKVGLLDKLAPFLQAVKDPRLKDLYVADVADRIQVEPRWVYRALKVNSEGRPAGVDSRPQPMDPQEEPSPAGPNSQVTQNEGSNVSSKRPQIVVRNPPKAEIYLVNMALMNESNFKKVRDSRVIEDFQSSALRELLSHAEQLYRQMPNEFDKLTALLVSDVDPPGAIGLHLDKPLVDMDEEGIEKLMADCLRRVRETHLRAQIKNISSHLQGKSPSEQIKQLEQIMNIHKDRQTLRKDKDHF